MIDKVKRRMKKKMRRAKLRGGLFPRLSVFRSQKHIYAQIIDDKKRETLVAASDLNLSLKGTKTKKAEEVGKILATNALKKGIDKVVFDRGSYAYHGRVKSLAEAARQTGLKF